MDTFSACVALGPLAIYLIVLGMINLSRRSLVVNGTRETMSLGLALAGLTVIGPMQLFMPQEAATRFGSWMWLLLITFYLLCLTMVLIVSRPRLVVYNSSLEQLREALAAVASRLDPEAVWAARSLSMPFLRVHLQLDAFEPLGNVSLVATSDDQSFTSWRRLESALAEQLRGTAAPPHRHRYWLFACGVMLLTALAMKVADEPQTVARGLIRLLNP